MHTHRGITVAIIVLLAVGGGYFYYKAGSGGEIIKDAAMREEVAETMMESEEDETAPMEDTMESDVVMKDSVMEDMAVEFTGTVLAGNTSPLLEFNMADYEKARMSDKLVVLYFYANWCPFCIAEFPKMQSVFNTLAGSGVVGFRIHYNDNETTDAEVALAREFGVAYQHTKVFLKGGERVLKSPETWDEARYSNEISTFSN